jgi:hypothetical protein
MIVPPRFLSKYPSKSQPLSELLREIQGKELQTHDVRYEQLHMEFGRNPENLFFLNRTVFTPIHFEGATKRTTPRANTIIISCGISFPMNY